MRPCTALPHPLQSCSALLCFTLFSPTWPIQPSSNLLNGMRYPPRLTKLHCSHPPRHTSRRATRKFVGRVSELNVLRGIASVLKGGEGRAESLDDEKGIPPTMILGAQGIGKSALLDEFAMVAREHDDLLVLRGHCRATEWSTSFFPFRSVFADLFKINYSGSIAAKTKALLAAIEENGFFRTIPHRPLLKAVLAVDLVDTYATKKMTGTTKSSNTVTVLKRFLQAQSFLGAIVVLLDDVQWIDLDSIALLNELADVQNVTIVCANRQERKEASDASSSGVVLPKARQMHLKPLELAETKDFLLQHYDVKDVQEHVLEFSHNRSTGNPATLITLTASLIRNEIFTIDDNRRLVLNPKKLRDPSQLDKLETPDSVRELIRMRVAKLESSKLEILFMAATIGRIFSFATLEDALRDRGTQIAGMAERLQELNKIGLIKVEQGLVRIVMDRRNLTFRFASVAIMDTAYEMQGIGGRQSNHSALARVLQAK